MISLKEHFKLTAVYTFFAAFPAFLQMIVYPIIEGEGRLGAVDFGYLAITEAIITAVFIFCLFGTSGGIARLYYDCKENSNDYNNLVSTVLTGILSRGILLLGLVFILGPFIGPLFPQDALQNFDEYGLSLIIAGINRTIIVMIIVLYRQEKRLLSFIIVSLLSGLFRSVFQLAGVFFYDISFIGYVYGTAIGGSFISLGIVIYTYYKCGFHYNKNINKGLYPFSRPLFFSDILFWGLLFADRFFLLNKPDDLGIYDNAVKFALGVQLVIQGLSSSVQPEIFRYLKEGVKTREADIKKLSNLFIAESICAIVLCIIPAMIFINLFYETQLRLSAGLIAIVFVRFILISQYSIFALPVIFSKKTNMVFFINSGVLILNLTINWLLTPRIGYNGAIIAFLVAFFIQVIGFRIVQQKIIPIRWNYRKVFYFPFIIVFLAVLLEIIKIIYNINPYITSSLLVILIIGGLLLLYKSELVNYVKNFRKI